MIVTFTTEDVVTAEQDGSIVILTGTNEARERVTIGGDFRPMAEIVSALLNDVEDEVTVDVDGWQILRVQKAA